MLDGENSKMSSLEKFFIMGKRFDEHLKNGAGFKLSLQKCSIYQKEVKYLGHKLTQKGVSMNKDNIKAVSGWSTTTNLTELKSVLGLCIYYR